MVIDYDKKRIFHVPLFFLDKVKFAFVLRRKKSC